MLTRRRKRWGEMWGERGGGEEEEEEEGEGEKNEIHTNGDFDLV